MTGSLCRRGSRLTRTGVPLSFNREPFLRKGVAPHVSCPVRFREKGQRLSVNGEPFLHK